MTDFSLSGKDADQFAFGGQNCKSSAVPASGDCWVEVRFVPTRAGSHVAAVTISSDATSGPDTISLSGLGTSPATPPQPTNPPFVPTQPAPPVGGPTTSPVALAQTASTPPRSVRVKRSAPLPTRTAQGSPISWKSQSPRVCKVKRTTVKGLKKGTCTLGASAPGSAALAPWSNRYRVRVR